MFVGVLGCRTVIRGCVYAALGRDAEGDRIAPRHPCCELMDVGGGGGDHKGPASSSRRGASRCKVIDNRAFIEEAGDLVTLGKQVLGGIAPALEGPHMDGRQARQLCQLPQRAGRQDRPEDARFWRPRGERVTAATDEHAPPEYHAKEPPRADESFDLWSAGSLLFTAHTGKKVYQTAALADVDRDERVDRYRAEVADLDAFQEALHKRIDGSACNRQFAKLLKTLLCARPADRCSARKALEHDVLHLTGSGTTSITKSGEEPRTQRRRNRELQENCHVDERSEDRNRELQEQLAAQHEGWNGSRRWGRS